MSALTIEHIFSVLTIEHVLLSKQMPCEAGVTGLTGVCGGRCLVENTQPVYYSAPALSRPLRPCSTIAFKFEKTSQFVTI